MTSRFHTKMLSKKRTWFCFSSNRNCGSWECFLQVTKQWRSL